MEDWLDSYEVSLGIATKTLLPNRKTRRSTTTQTQMENRVEPTMKPRGGLAR